MSIRSVVQKCRLEVLFRSGKCRLEVSFRSVDQKCRSEVSIRSVAHKRCCLEVSIVEVWRERERERERETETETETERERETCQTTCLTSCICVACMFTTAGLELTTPQQQQSHAKLLRHVRRSSISLSTTNYRSRARANSRHSRSHDQNRTTTFRDYIDTNCHHPSSLVTTPSMKNGCSNYKHTSAS